MKVYKDPIVLLLYQNVCYLFARKVQPLNGIIQHYTLMRQTVDVQRAT